MNAVAVVFGVIWYIAVCIFVGVIASNNNRSGWWFFLALIFSPVLSMLGLIALGRDEIKQQAIVRPSELRKDDSILNQETQTSKKGPKKAWLREQ